MNELGRTNGTPHAAREVPAERGMTLGAIVGSRLKLRVRGPKFMRHSPFRFPLRNGLAALRTLACTAARPRNAKQPFFPPTSPSRDRGLRTARQYLPAFAR